MSVVAVTLQAVQPQDYKRLAYLEATAFGDDEFTQVAFGSQRFDDKVQEARGKEMSNWTNKPGEVVKYVKAVRTAADGTERIVGFAHWVTVRPSLGGVGVYGAGKEEEEKFKKDSKEDIKLGEEARGKVETVINEKLCHDLFVPGDQYMAKACEGKDYHKLCSLMVDRGCQRQGIGSLLLKEGLDEADQAGLQCVLGASPEGLSLYKKYGFAEFQDMSLDLKDYEGGQGMGFVHHCIMHRQAFRN